jgi:hypothetical protein
MKDITVTLASDELEAVVRHSQVDYGMMQAGAPDEVAPCRSGFKKLQAALETKPGALRSLDEQFISGRVTTGQDTVHGIVGVCLRCRWTTTMVPLMRIEKIPDGMETYLDQIEQHQRDGCAH